MGFTEKDKKPKDEEKIIITPAVLPEREEEVSEEEEEVKPEPKKKLSKADLKPSVVIKVDTVADTKVAKRKKKLAEKEESLFGDDETDMKQKEKPKVRDIYEERRKKALDEESVVITPKDLTTQEGEPTQENVPDDQSDTGDVDRKRDKVNDHFPERETHPKEEEKIII